MLDFIIKLVTIIFTEFIHILCYQKLTGKLYKVNIKNILCLISLSVVAELNNMYTPIGLKALVTFFIMAVIMFFWFRLSWKENLKICLIISIVSIIMEIALTCFTSLMVDNVYELNQYTVPKISYTVILGVLLYFFFSFIKLSKILKYKIEYFCCCLAALLNILLIYYNEKYSNYNIIFNIIIAIFILILFTITLIALHRRKVYKIKSEDLAEKVKHYEQIAEDFRELKHNLNNDLITIKTTVDSKSQEVIDELIKKYNKSYGWLTTIEKIPKGLQGLIYIKLNEIPKNSLCVEINNQITSDIISNLTAKSYAQLCNALGIIVDNAIRGAINSVDKVLYISLEEQNNPKQLFIKVINTFNGSIDLDEIGKLNYSTKKNKSGIGLQYLNKMKDIKIKKEIVNNLFIVSISVWEEAC